MRQNQRAFYNVNYVMVSGKISDQTQIIASKLLAKTLGNFLRMCLEVLTYFALEASKKFLFSYRTGYTVSLCILNDITPFSIYSYFYL